MPNFYIIKDTYKVKKNRKKAKIDRKKSKSWLQKVKKNHLRKFFQDNFQNSRGTWKKINELLNKKPNKNDDTVINENGAIICNQKLVSNKFNNYFVNVAQNLVRELG